jgi:Flp pilus assembly protein TadG
MKARQTGTAIVEFALVLPLLLLLTMTTTEFGRAIYQYNSIVKSLRDATRYLSIQTPNTKITEAKNLVVFGNIAGTGQALVTGLTVAKVAAPTWQLTGSDPLIKTVTITVTGYKFHSMFSSVFGVTFGDTNGDISFGNISATMRSPI